jgi:hypothetical protein
MLLFSKWARAVGLTVLAQIGGGEPRVLAVFHLGVVDVSQDQGDGLVALIELEVEGELLAQLGQQVVVLLHHVQHVGRDEVGRLLVLAVVLQMFDQPLAIELDEGG